MFKYLRLSFYKICANLMLFADGNCSAHTRVDSYLRVLILFGPTAFLSELLGYWFIENQTFTLFSAGFVVANAVIGAIAHYARNDFKWETWFIQTGKMVGIITVTYIVLEGIVSPIRVDSIRTSSIAVFQVATLLYPGSKILKNIFIWSDGEHPPRWFMQKVYNFKQNGDLNAFLNDSNSDNKKDFDLDNFNK